jgi:hypothetical protein
MYSTGCQEYGCFHAFSAAQVPSGINSVVVTDGRSPSPPLERHRLELLVAAIGVGSNQPLPALTVHALPAASPSILVEDRSTLILRI